MTLLVFAYVVFVLFCTFLLFTTKILFVDSIVVAIDVFLKSFISLSLIANVTSQVKRYFILKYDSLNPNLDTDSLIEYTFFTESGFGFNMYLNPDLLIKYPHKRVSFFTH